MIKNDWKIPLYKVWVDEEDEKELGKIIRRGNYWALGPEIEEFEKRISEYVGIQHTVVFNSGTSALHATLLANEVGHGDEVIVPSFSFVSTANSVLFVDAKPVFSDIEEENFGLDPKLIPEKINLNTKAIMPMDYGGMACKIDDLKEIAEEKNILLIDDSAEGLGATVNGKKCGSVADCSIFSFAGNKVLTTGEGGAVVTNSYTIFEKLKLIRSHGRLDSGNYFDNPNVSEYIGLGYNWRMSSITAALGIQQIEKLDKLIKMRQENAQYLSKNLSKIPQIKTPFSPEGYSNIYQMYTIRLPGREIRDRLHHHLTKYRIFSKVYFSPIHLTKFYREKLDCKEGLLPQTEKISSQVLTLPMFPGLTKEEMDFMIGTIKEFFESSMD